MKINSLLLLAVLAVTANAAQPQTDSDLVVLPTYVVQAARHLPLEQQINTSLDEARQFANLPLAITVECPALKAFARQSASLALKVESNNLVRVAKS